MMLRDVRAPFTWLQQLLGLFGREEGCCETAPRACQGILSVGAPDCDLIFWAAAEADEEAHVAFYEKLQQQLGQFRCKCGRRLSNWRNFDYRQHAWQYD